MKSSYKLFALILSVSAFTLILSSCAATEDSTRLSPLEQALTDAVTIDLSNNVQQPRARDYRFHRQHHRPRHRHHHHYWQAAHQCLPRSDPAIMY